MVPTRFTDRWIILPAVGGHLFLDLVGPNPTRRVLIKFPRKMHSTKTFRLSLLIACLLLSVACAHAAPACALLSKLMDHQKEGPIFLASFPTVKSGPLDEVSFTYDNSVALIALLACGKVEQAAKIGDAFLAALDHDRYWHDGRLRNGYLAGGAEDHPLKLPGWWDTRQNMWVEDQYQVGSDTGNQAWAMLALITLSKAGAGPQYLSGATRIASYLEKSFDGRAPAGFSGGTFGDEPKPVANNWKSTEHNTDLAAAFMQLAQATGDHHWLIRAREAQIFVRSMWERHCRCFAAGTSADGHTRNPLLALDANLWPLLAIAGYARRFSAAIATIDTRLKDGDGFSYSEAKEGVWTEGTAQVGLLDELLNRRQSARALLAAVEKNRSPDGSYYAADTTGLPTGFRLETDPATPRVYFRLASLSALSWVALAQEHFNPFAASVHLPHKLN